MKQHCRDLLTMWTREHFLVDYAVVAGDLDAQSTGESVPWTGGQCPGQWVGEGEYPRSAERGCPEDLWAQRLQSLITLTRTPCDRRGVVVGSQVWVPPLPRGVTWSCAEVEVDPPTTTTSDTVRLWGVLEEQWGWWWWFRVRGPGREEVLGP